MSQRLDRVETRRATRGEIAERDAHDAGKCKRYHDDRGIEDQIDEEAAAWLRKHKPSLQDGTPEWEIALDKTKDSLASSKGYVIR